MLQVTNRLPEITSVLLSREVPSGNSLLILHIVGLSYLLCCSVIHTGAPNANMGYTLEFRLQGTKINGENNT